MHEQVYRLLLRLYPAQFRRTHGEEALQLFRDRLRDETGFVRRVRLWLDLLGDFGAIRIHGYRERPLPAAVVVSGYGGKRVPSFGSLEEGSLQAGSLLWGGVLSVALCGSALFALEHGRGHLQFHNAVSYSSPGVPKSRVRVEFTCQPLNQSKTRMVRLKAVVEPLNGGPMPTGTVSFDYGWRTVAIGALVDGMVVIDTKLPNNKGLAMDALYLGDANYSIARSTEANPSSSAGH
jgi:hypothetical protein